MCDTKNWWAKNCFETERKYRMNLIYFFSCRQREKEKKRVDCLTTFISIILCFWFLFWLSMSKGIVWIRPMSSFIFRLCSLITNISDFFSWFNLFIFSPFIGIFKSLIFFKKKNEGIACFLEVLNEWLHLVWKMLLSPSQIY